MLLNYFPQQKISKDFGQRFHKNQHEFISMGKRSLTERNEKRKPPSFMMCYHMILMKYRKKILSKSEWKEEEPGSERSLQRMWASFPILLLPYFKDSKTLYFLHFNITKIKVYLIINHLAYFNSQDCFSVGHKILLRFISQWAKYRA